MFTALIIDDVQKARMALSADLKDYCTDIRVIGEAEGVNSGISAIQIHKPNVVFLDIQMDDGTGFDLLNKIGKIDFQVIFTTAFDAYAIKAFKFSAVDYLLKPIDPDELTAAVQKLKKPYDLGMQLPSYELLLENIKKIHQSDVKRIALNTQDKVHVVSISDILRCESHSNYTLFYLNDGSQILVTKTLKEYENLLMGSNFLRCHHSHLINMKYLKEFVKTDGGFVIMKDGNKVPVSTRKKEVLVKKLQEL